VRLGLVHEGPPDRTVRQQEALVPPPGRVLRPACPVSSESTGDQIRWIPPGPTSMDLRDVPRGNRMSAPRGARSARLGPPLARSTPAGSARGGLPARILLNMLALVTTTGPAARRLNRRNRMSR
jgi:hypothetical protein